MRRYLLGLLLLASCSEGRGVEATITEPNKNCTGFCVTLVVRTDPTSNAKSDTTNLGTGTPAAQPQAEAP